MIRAILVPEHYIKWKDLDTNSFETRKLGRSSCHRSWYKWGDLPALAQVCMYAWEMYGVVNGREAPFCPHVWMRAHDWRQGEGLGHGDADAGDEH